MATSSQWLYSGRMTIPLPSFSSTMTQQNKLPNRMTNLNKNGQSGEQTPCSSHNQIKRNKVREKAYLINGMFL